MSFCRQCGATVDATAQYCVACGTPQQTPGALTTVQPSAAAISSSSQARAHPDLPGGIITIFGGTLLLISSFLPWSTAQIGFSSLDRNAYQLGANMSFSAAGLVLTLLGLVGILIGVTRILRASLPPFVQRSPIVLGIFAMFVPLGERGAINSYAQRVMAASSLAHAAVGFGLWLAIFAAVVTIVGGVVLRSQSKSAVASQPRASTLDPAAAAPAPAGPMNGASAPPVFSERTAWASAADPLARPPWATSSQDAPGTAV